MTAFSSSLLFSLGLLATAGVGAPPPTLAPATIAWRFAVRDSALRAVTPGQTPVTLWDSTENSIDDQEQCTARSSAEARSLVGGIASWYTSGGEECAHTAHPSSWARFQTRNLTTRTEADLRQIFAPSDLLAALAKDKVILKAVGKTPTSLEEIETADGGCEMAFAASIWKTFAFHHLNKDSVAVRIGLTHGCEAARGNFTQLGIWLPIPPQWSAAFHQAEAAGLLMKALAKRR